MNLSFKNILRLGSYLNINNNSQNFCQKKTISFKISVFCYAIEDEAELSTEENSRRSSFVAPPSTRLQLTFDFHRLNILLLRAVVQDSVVVGRKVATVTLSHAKINAGVGEF